MISNAGQSGIDSDFTHRVCGWAGFLAGTGTEPFSAEAIGKWRLLPLLPAIW